MYMIDFYTNIERNMFKEHIVLPLAISSLDGVPSEIDLIIKKDKICYEILCGISYLHSNFIIHRDIKPHNILLMKDLSIKIADFDCVKSYAHPSRYNYTDEVTSLLYRAPEILLNTDKYDVKIDIWSLGCTFFDIYTKNRLFNGTDEYTQLIEIFSIMGKPDKDNWPEALLLPGWRRNLQKYDENKILIKNKLNAAGYLEVYSIISKMLIYRPSDRANIFDILNDTYWDNRIERIKENEHAPSDYISILRKHERYITLMTKRKNTDRNSCIKWMAEVCMTFKLNIRTLMAAIQIFDEIIDNVEHNNSQLLLMACISISADINSLYIPKGHDWRTISNQINLKELSMLKMKILKYIRYDIVFTVSTDFAYEISNKKERSVIKALIIIIQIYTDLCFIYMPYDIYNICTTLYYTYAYNSKKVSLFSYIDVNILRNEIKNVINKGDKLIFDHYVKSNKNSIVLEDIQDILLNYMNNKSFLKM